MKDFLTLLGCQPCEITNLTNNVYGKMLNQATIQCILREIYWIISNTYLFHDLEICSHGFGEAREQAELWDQAYNLVNSLLGLRLLLWSVKITTFKICSRFMGFTVTRKN